MDEYLEYMKTLRSQMNDVEDQAAKISVEEQMQITTIHTMDKDLHSVKSETKQLKEDTEKMVKAKGQTCSQILERQRKIASLESDSSTLTQSLELIQHERFALSAKLKEKSTYYTKVVEEMNAKLQEQQDWINSHRPGPEVGEHGLVKDKIDEQTGEAEGDSNNECHLIMDSLGDEARKNLAELDSFKVKLNELSQMKSKLVLENSKLNCLTKSYVFHLPE
ncbi:hypothetical protein L1049_025503 [Liquidambar formosana]|uniref:Uncharacterized protein n=1 Tax=Liquidambar formosana TaxID=63359 RepID=A0AAP0NDS4_LIQFO